MAATPALLPKVSHLLSPAFSRAEEARQIRLGRERIQRRDDLRGGSETPFPFLGQHPIKGRVQGLACFSV